MGACATKPKTLEGKAPEGATPIETAPKVALETAVNSHEEVVADQAPEKVVEEATVIAELPPTDNAIMQNKEEEEEVQEKIVEEEKFSVPAAEQNTEVNNTKVVEETIEVKNTEVGKGTTEVKNTEEEKPIQS
uniref:Uncharacterized protein n=1 Tax=Oryza punctata TaxID=4537 RepID=A0A0E0L760_ORYPU